jgi:hypothetical protein
VSQLEKQLREDLDHAEQIRDGARAESSWSAAVQAQAKVSALREKLSALREARIASKYDDPIDRVRHQILQAERSQSWQAAARLNAHLAELLAAKEQRDRELAAENDLDRMDPDALFDIIEAAVDKLPDLYLERLGHRVAGRLGMDLSEPAPVHEVAEA